MFRGLRGLALLYAVLFALVTAGLGITVYFATTRALAAQVDARLVAESSAVLGSGVRSPIGEIAARVARRDGRRATADLSYLLVDAQGRRMAGRLDTAVPLEGFSDVMFRDGADGSDRGRALATSLVGGGKLVVVADSEPVETFDDLLIRIFEVAFGAAILVGALGGWLLSAAIGRRVGGINRAADAIIDGDLSHRMPLDGSGDVFDRQSATLNRMLDRVAELMANLRQVSNDIAHDLRTPLTRLRNRLDSASRHGRDPDEVRLEIGRSVVDADALLETFAALLRISQIEAGARKAAFEWLDLAGLVRDVAETFAPPLEDGGRRLRIRIHIPCFVHGDRELLTQMTVNLVENAARHTPPGTLISVSLSSRGGRAVLAVADDGPGIGDAEPIMLIRRFTRLDASRASDGNGLGLALVDAVARLHDATLSLVDNEPGLRAEVEFPKIAGQE